MSTTDDDCAFALLDRRAHAGDIVFRVYTDLSASPLVWTGDSATSGFFAPNGYLRISPSVYTRLLPGIQTAYSLVDGQYTRHSLVDHILGKAQQTCVLVPSSLQERDSTAEDDKSCWISCTGSLVWAMWELARRIAVEGCSEVHVALIKRKPNKQKELAGEAKDYAGREISVIPGRSISAGLREGRAQQLFSLNTREAYETAAQQAMESEERLYYGRIFAESIEADLIFTREHLPIELPLYFFASTIDQTDPPRNAARLARPDEHVRVSTHARSGSSSPTKQSWRGTSFHGTLGGAIASSKAQVVHGRDRTLSESSGLRPHSGVTTPQASAATTPRPPAAIPPTTAETWLDRLAWSPYTDTFRTAAHAISRRRSELDSQSGLKTMMH